MIINHAIISELRGHIDAMRPFSPGKICDDLIDTFEGFLDITSRTVTRLNGECDVRLVSINIHINMVIDIQAWIENHNVAECFRILMDLTDQGAPQKPVGEVYSEEKEYFGPGETDKLTLPAPKKTQPTRSTGQRRVTVRVMNMGDEQIKHRASELKMWVLSIAGSDITVRTTIPAFHIAAEIGRILDRDVWLIQALDELRPLKPRTGN